MIVRIDTHQIYLRQLKVAITILLYIGIVNESRINIIIRSFYITISFSYFASGAGGGSICAGAFVQIKDLECSAYDLRAASKMQAGHKKRADTHCCVSAL